VESRASLRIHPSPTGSHPPVPGRCRSPAADLDDPAGHGPVGAVGARRLRHRRRDHGGVHGGSGGRVAGLGRADRSGRPAPGDRPPGGCLGGRPRRPHPRGRRRLVRPRSRPARGGGRDHLPADLAGHASGLAGDPHRRRGSARCLRPGGRRGRGDLRWRPAGVVGTARARTSAPPSADHVGAARGRWPRVCRDGCRARLATGAAPAGRRRPRPVPAAFVRCARLAGGCPAGRHRLRPARRLPGGHRAGGLRQSGHGGPAVHGDRRRQRGRRGAVRAASLGGRRAHPATDRPGRASRSD